MTGKRIGAGPRGSTSGDYFPRIFDTLKIPALLVNGSVEEMMSKISAKQLDGVALATGVPAPALLELDQTEGMQFIPFTSDQIGILRQRMPELSDSVIRQGMYPSLTVEYQTIGLFNFVVAHKDLSDDLAYQIVKTTFDKHARLVQAHSAAKETIYENITRDTFLPIHPGAVRYYRELGIELANDR